MSDAHEPKRPLRRNDPVPHEDESVEPEVTARTDAAADDATEDPVASPPPMTIEQWLAAAPKLKEGEFGAEAPGQPVDVVPILGMTPITEQERAASTEEAAVDFDPLGSSPATAEPQSSSFYEGDPDAADLAATADASAVLPEAAREEPVYAIAAEHARVEPASPEPLEVVESHSAVVAAEPSPRELAVMPPEPEQAIPLANFAPAVPVHATDAGESIHDQTSTDVFVHAHEDVESRRGPLSNGYITKFAGLAGLIACIGGLAVLLTACAGVRDIKGFVILNLGWWIMWTGVGGIAVALLGGLIEHRRLREETHVLGALFSNALAAIGGLLLWFAANGTDIFSTGTKAAGG
jgi:hypothetical protein